MMDLKVPLAQKGREKNQLATYIFDICIQLAIETSFGSDALILFSLIQLA